jgi:hypothetical protein
MKISNSNPETLFEPCSNAMQCTAALKPHMLQCINVTPMLLLHPLLLQHAKGTQCTHNAHIMHI